MKMTTVINISMFLAALILTGCASHYAVTDLTSGNSYFTNDIERNEGGSIRFTDAKSGKVVTLQSSEVKKISEDEYNIAVVGAAKPN